MATATPLSHYITNKLQYLSEQHIREIKDFVDFLISQEEKEKLTLQASKLAEPSFKKIWDNDNDDIYNKL